MALKPTVTIDKPKAPTIRVNEGARNAIVPVRNSNVVKIPAPSAGERAGNALGSVASALGSLIPSFGFSYSGGNKTDNRQIDNRKYDQRQYSDNRQVTNVDGRTFVDEHNQTFVDYDETNITNINESYNQSYSAQSYTSNAYTDNSVTSVSVDNSQHYTDQSQHWTTNITDNSQHWTDNSKHLSITSVNNTQSVILALFFGDGLEKVLMALVMLGVLITIFLTELLLIAGGLAAFAIAYKTAKFAWQRHEANVTRKFQAAEAEKQRAHELELARLKNNRSVLHIHVKNAADAAKVVEQVSQPKPKPAALPEPTYFEPDAPSAVSPTKAEKVKQAAKKHAKKQANLFVDGIKHDVIGMKKGRKH